MTDPSNPSKSLAETGRRSATGQAAIWFDAGNGDSQHFRGTGRSGALAAEVLLLLSVMAAALMLWAFVESWLSGETAVDGLADAASAFAFLFGAVLLFGLPGALLGALALRLWTWHASSHGWRAVALFASAYVGVWSLAVLLAQPAGTDWFAFQDAVWISAVVVVSGICMAGSYWMLRDFRYSLLVAAAAGLASAPAGLLVVFDGSPATLLPVAFLGAAYAAGGLLVVYLEREKGRPKPSGTGGNP